MTRKTITRSDLIQRLANTHQLSPKAAENLVKSILGSMSQALNSHQRIEIRGFGSFEAKAREARKARNPKTGETVTAPPTTAIHFKAGKELKERVNESAQK